MSLCSNNRTLNYFTTFTEPYHLTLYIRAFLRFFIGRGHSAILGYGAGDVIFVEIDLIICIYPCGINGPIPIQT